MPPPAFASPAASPARARARRAACAPRPDEHDRFVASPVRGARWEADAWSDDDEDGLVLRRGRSVVTLGGRSDFASDAGDVEVTPRGARALGVEDTESEGSDGGSDLDGWLVPDDVDVWDGEEDDAEADGGVDSAHACASEACVGGAARYAAAAVLPAPAVREVINLVSSDEEEGGVRMSPARGTRARARSRSRSPPLGELKRNVGRARGRARKVEAVPRVGLKGEDVWLHAAWAEAGGTRKYSFERYRDAGARALVAYFDEEVLGGALRGKVQVEWNKRLAKTAGRCIMRRRGPRRECVVEMSAKVVDDAERLYHTLAHELCHAAVWVAEGVSSPPHGARFFRCAARFRAWDPVLRITRCHAYKIQYRFTYTCAQCGYAYGRHSNSIDVDKLLCGKCRGPLVMTKKKPAEMRRAASLRSRTEDVDDAHSDDGPATPPPDVVDVVDLVGDSGEESDPDFDPGVELQLSSVDLDA